MNDVIIKPRPNGPYEVKGSVVIEDTHSKIGLQAAEKAVASKTPDLRKE